MKCPICSIQSTTVLTDKLRRGEGIVFYCAECDLGFLDKPKNIDYYLDGYRKEVSHHSHEAETNPVEIFNTYSPHQAERIKFIPHCQSLLEIGASAGQFISQSKASRKVAVEPDIACAEFMRSKGIEIAQNIPNDGSFDAVCAFQVMEHTENPVEFLSSIRGAMKDSGKAYVEVPNLHDPLLSVWGIEEYRPFYYHAQHSFYFTEKSVNVIAKKAGLKVEECHYTQDYNILNHLHWIMNKSPQPTCEIGLGEVHVEGKNKFISEWLSNHLKNINDEYIKLLSESRCTSNLMFVFSKLLTT